MLVLNRKIGEKIMIGDGITVTLVRIDRNQVRIGIDAPPEVPIHREEILPAAREGQQGVAPASPTTVPPKPQPGQGQRSRKGRE